MKLRLLILLLYFSTIGFGQRKITSFANSEGVPSWDFGYASVGEYLFLKSGKYGDSEFEIWKLKNNKVEGVTRMKVESLKLYAGVVDKEELFIGTEDALFVLNVNETEPVFLGEVENAYNLESYFTLGNTYLVNSKSVITVFPNHEITKRSISGVNLSFQTFKDKLLVLDRAFGKDLSELSIYDGSTMTSLASGNSVNIMVNNGSNLFYTEYKDSKGGYYFLDSDLKVNYLGDSWFRNTDNIVYSRNHDNMDLVDMLSGEIIYRHAASENLQYSTSQDGKHFFIEYDYINERASKYHVIEDGVERTISTPEYFNGTSGRHFKDKGWLEVSEYELDGQRHKRVSFIDLETQNAQIVLDIPGWVYLTKFEDVILMDVREQGKEIEWLYWSPDMEKPERAFKYEGEGQYSYPIFSNAIYTKSDEGGYGIYKVEDGKLKEPFFFKGSPLFHPETQSWDPEKLFFKKFSAETGFEIEGFTLDGLENYKEIAEGEEGIFHEGYEVRIFNHLNDYYVLAHTTTDGWQVWNLDAEVEIALGLSETDLVVFPNPSTDRLNIKMDNESATYSLFSSDGRKVKSANLEKGESAIDVSSLQHGLYFIKLKMGDKTVIKRFLKE